MLLMAYAVCLAGLSGRAQTAGPSDQPAAVKPPGPGKISQLGDPAPPITVLEWIKGKPVKIHPGTNFYALVFCDLTKASDTAITNLCDLQMKYQNRGFVLVTVSYEPPAQLQEFVRAEGARINFTVAADDLPARTARNYQIAFGQNRLPQAYVINQDGKVVWYGHPLSDGLGLVVDELASGRFNLEQTKEDVMHREQIQEYVTLARQNDPRTRQAGQILLALWTNNAPALCDLALQVASSPYIANRDVALLNAALDRAAQISNTNATDIAVDRAILLFQTGQEDAGLAMARKAQANAKTDDDKIEAKTCVHAMEVRMAAEKTNHASSASSPAGATTSTAAKN
ncbi:MAG TPA: redoxin domain-containing protein [Candidatus Acidoferrales bacterium]|nr:redoxin domain-containing protein [Candidatus Acidoferrales bacterium]